MRSFILVLSLGLAGCQTSEIASGLQLAANSLGGLQSNNQQQYRSSYPNYSSPYGQQASYYPGSYPQASNYYPGYGYSVPQSPSFEPPQTTGSIANPGLEAAPPSGNAYFPPPSSSMPTGGKEAILGGGACAGFYKPQGLDGISTAPKSPVAGAPICN
ncbi:hypothetical protein HPT29_020445 [Microvirga terrae]|uniref:Uncharacterized protein n=1 Tax=Microvirga terrae TaxID=2740529 RepID=A0ABY5RNL5_9HYPH|nr:hypothetical protein [Microvirga terrae]UVF18825.1 hypothetical protein HPT29_020445 [Microvirga terrae]